MGAFLELLEEKKEMSLISVKYFNQQTGWYNQKALKQGVKDNYDKRAEKKLALLKQDKSTFLTLELISVVKDTKNITNEIKGWVKFLGIMFIVGIAISVLTLANA